MFNLPKLDALSQHILQEYSVIVFIDYVQNDIISYSNLIFMAVKCIFELISRCTNMLVRFLPQI